jgi:hypothetical protein
MGDYEIAHDKQQLLHGLASRGDVIPTSRGGFHAELAQIRLE